MQVLFYLLLASFCKCSFAATNPLLISQEMDASIGYLSMIFGVVDGVLHGSGSQIAGQLFALLSTILLCCAGVLWTYVTFVGVLNTASEGQFLGQRWSSMWIPIRVLGGFCLLMPKGISGYSLIQIIVMSVIVQGVGAANLAWRKTLDYLGEGGTIVESVTFLKGNKSSLAESLPSEEVMYSDLLEQAAKVLQSEVCMMVFHYKQQGVSTQHGLAPPVNFARLLKLGRHAKGVGHEQTIEFPASGTSKKFGSISWTSRLVPNVMMQNQGYDLYQAAIERLVLNLLPVAQRIALKVIAEGESNQESETDFFTQGEAFSLVKAVHSTIGMLKLVNKNQLLIQSQKKQNALRMHKENMQAAGWVTAGNWYRLIAAANQKNTPVDVTSLHHNIQSTCSNEVLVEQRLSSSAQAKSFNTCLQALKEFTQQERKRLVSYHQAAWFTHEPNTSNASVDYVNEWLLNPLQNNSQQFQKHMQSILDQERDPILALSSIGEKLLKAVEATWTKINQGKLKFSGMWVESTVNGKWEVVNRDLAAQNLLSDLIKCIALLPLLITWMLLNFTLGSILVYYVPLIPFLIFFFRSLTWFGSVIIAIVAAPCVAIGLMSPEGHPIMGFAEQAVRRLVDLFLCPILMIFGLIFGMILCTVIFEFFHYGYSIVSGDLMQFSGVLSGVYQIAITTLYTTAAMAIVSRCFGLIYELPAKTLSWIGWPTEGHSEAEVLNQVRSGIDQQVSGVGRSVTSGLVEKHAAPQDKNSGRLYDATIRAS